MNLTIPKGGVVGGATASPQIEANQTGAILADFGQRVIQIGQQVQQERDRRSLSRARVEMMTGLNDVSLEMDQVGDPDEIDTLYPQRAQTVKDRVLADLPQSVREDAELAFDEMNAAHAARQGQRALGLRKSADMATVMATSDQLVRAASIADPQTQATYRAQMDDQLGEMVARGVIAPDEAERIRQSTGTQMEGARATRMLSDDPDGLVAAIDGGEFDQLGGDAIQGWRARGVAASKAQAARLQAESDRARAESLREAGQVMKDGIAVLRKGQPFARAEEVNAWLSDPEIAALPEAQEYAATAVLVEQRPDIAMLPIGKKRELLAELEARPAAKDFETDTATALRGMISDDEKRFAEDPLGRAAEIGLKAAPTLPDPATANPEDLFDGLRARARYAQSLASAGYVEPEATKLFTPEERDNWAKAVAIDASPEERARLAQSMAAALGPMSDQAAQEIGADPTFAYVGAGMNNGLSPRLGRQIFEGQRIIDGQQVKLPPVTDRRQTFFSKFSKLFPDGTEQGWADQSGARDQITAAADALYAYRMRGKVSSGTEVDGQVEETTYLQAVHEVMGGSGSYDSRGARGGLQEVRDQITILPSGVSGREVTDRLDGLASLSGTPEMGELAWQGISATGNLPELGGERPDARSIGRMQLRAVGPDQYLMVWPNSSTGEMTVVMGDDGRPFAISLSALLKQGATE
ncbi:MAG: hypothetical protein ACU0FT_04225 [Paracoccus sp. (in: a-proteobacteria)]|uniref:hypothetical protein n=1 Tax=Paracoccus sp. TaxID=267 RepID=UPI004058F5ED